MGTILAKTVCCISHKDASTTTGLGILSANEVLALAEEAQRLAYSGEELPPLVHAAATGREVAVERYLQEGGSLWERDAAGRTPLHWAASASSERLVGPLLLLGAEVEARDRRGRTPLHHAALGRSRAATGRLLMAGASAAAKDSEGRTPLMYAAAAGDALLCQLLAGDGRGPQLEAADLSSQTALHLAAGAGRAAVVKVLVARGASVNAVDGEQRVPLHCALNFYRVLQDGKLLARHRKRKRSGKSDAEGESGDSEEATRQVVKALMAGVDAVESASHRDKLGMTPLTWALRLRLPTIARLLINAYGPDWGTDVFGKTALHWAAHAGDAYIVRRLLQHAFSPWEPDKKGCDALMSAVESRSIKTVKTLLKHYKYVSRKNLMGETALHKAVALRDAEMTQCLLYLGARIGRWDRGGRTALFRALQTGREGRKVVKVLLSVGAYDKQGMRTDVRGRTLLHAAAEGGDAEMVRELLRLGASPRAVDADDESPLAVALRMRHRAVAALLMRRRNLRLGPDRRGRTPLHWAAAAGWREEARALLQAGCDPAHRDNNGRSAIVTATEHCHWELADELLKWSLPKECSQSLK